MAMPDLQRYPRNLNLNQIKNVNLFLTQKVFTSVSFTIASFKHVTFTEKPQMKINSLKKQKH